MKVKQTTHVFPIRLFIIRFTLLLPFLFFLLGHSLWAVKPVNWEKIERGKIIEKVSCLHDSRETYSLYLPSYYNCTVKWPVLFTFDYEARSALPVSRFQTAAEEFGYIIISSDNTRNGRKAPILKAMEELWLEANTRFSIDRSRVYAAGLSGGARMSSIFHMVIDHPVRGIIGVGAGIAPHIKPKDIKDSYFFGICGYADFNYKEMQELEQKLEKLNIPNRFIFYANHHVWPPQEICTRALEWLELMNLKEKDNLTDHQKTFIQRIYKQETVRVKQRDRSGEIYYAAKDYHALAHVFEGLTDTAQLQRKADELSGLHAYKVFEQEDAERIKKERYYYRKMAGAFIAIEDSTPGSIQLEKLIEFMGVNELLHLLGNKHEPYLSSMAERTLYTLINKSRAVALDYMKAGDQKRAAVIWEIARLCRDHVYFFPDFDIYRACNFASLGQDSKAIKTLEQAIGKGYRDLFFIDHAAAFDHLRHKAGFKKVTRHLKKILSRP